MASRPPAEDIEVTKERGYGAQYVNQMGRYLEHLTLEFRDSYKPLSDAQRGYEERAKVMLERFAKADAEGVPPELRGFVWDKLAALERLSDFIGEGKSYRSSFEDPLDDASELLRAELARILRAAAPSTSNDPRPPLNRAAEEPRSASLDFP